MVIASALIVLHLVAGLGLIFAGGQTLTTSIKSLASRRLGRFVQVAVRTPTRAALSGIAAGAVLQSTNAVIFLAAGLVGAGSIAEADALPLVAWCYTGSSLRLLLVAIDVRWLTWSIMSATALLYQARWDRANSQRRSIVQALLGLALLLFGIETMTDAAAPLAYSREVTSAIDASARLWGSGIVIGAVLAAGLQGMTVSLVAIVLVRAGVLPVSAALLIVTGANVGSGVQSWVQASTLEGQERQLSVYQLLIKLLGAAILVPWLAAEHFAGIPGPFFLLTLLTTDPTLAVLGMHWLFQIVAALTATCVDAPMKRILPRLCPMAPPQPGSVIAKGS